MKNIRVFNVRGCMILAGLMILSLSGCEYWPPALLAQLEQLRNHVQDLSDERAELETHLREATVVREELMGQVGTLTRENRELRRQVTLLQRNVAAQRKTPAKVATSRSHTSVARGSADAKGQRVLYFKNPPMRGRDVRDLQRALSRIGVPVQADGFYGSDTRAAVKWFQRKEGLRADGMVGAGTWSAVNDRLTSETETRVIRFKNPPMKGPDVRKVQEALRHAGHSLRVDGTFGSNTQSAIKRFQRLQGLRADGVVGHATRNALGLS